MENSTSSKIKTREKDMNNNNYCIKTNNYYFKSNNYRKIYEFS